MSHCSVIVWIFQDQNDRPSFSEVHRKLFITCRTKSSPEKIDLSRTKSGDSISSRISGASASEGSVTYDDVPLEPPAPPAYNKKTRPIITQNKLNVYTPEHSDNDSENDSVYEDLPYENLQNHLTADTVTYTKIVTGAAIANLRPPEPDLYEDTMVAQSNENEEDTRYQVTARFSHLSLYLPLRWWLSLSWHIYCITFNFRET